MNKAGNYLKRHSKNIAGKITDKILDELFRLAKEIMDDDKIYPYVDMVVKNDEIISWGKNIERDTRDVTDQSAVVAIRKAQRALDIGDLSGYTLVSLFEPTILGFDVALWSGIKRFVWCINSSSLPNHYNKLKYNPFVYAKNHPGKIEIISRIREKDALELVKIAKAKKYYPDNLL